MNEYKYTYRTRGFSIGCQPDDFVRIEQENYKFETVIYNRLLSQGEVEAFELIDLNITEQEKQDMRDEQANDFEIIANSLKQDLKRENGNSFRTQLIKEEIEALETNIEILRNGGDL